MTERTLWQAVVYRGVLDALSLDPRVMTRTMTPARMDLLKRVQRDAHDWIAAPSRNFVRVCDMAGLDAGFIRDAYLSGRINPQYLRRAEVAQ